MPKQAVFTMKLEAELRDAFMAEAEAIDRPASQIVREMMRDFIERRIAEKASYEEFLRQKVERARVQIADGQWSTQADVEADANARRTRLMPSADDGHT